MISFEQFSIEDGSPLYLQIILHIKQGIVAGSIENQDEMPSRRVLSSLLGVNPNTVQKAYRILEEEQIVESRSGAKSYISINEKQIEGLRTELLQSNARAVIHAMKQMGITKDEALSLIERYWD